MKWIRWDGSDLFDFKINKPAEGSEDWDQCLAGEYVVCEKHDDWREIESGTLNPEDGRWHITLKPLPTPEKVPTLVEAAKHYLETDWQAYRSDGLQGLQSLRLSIDICKCAVQLAEAIEREEKKPANPYMKEEVDEALDALDDGGYEFAKQNPIPNQAISEKYKRIYNAFRVLLSQREAANVT